ncbi:TIGR04283 family arsenosugar biosynthesis glycosyltransferase [bacterium]|nr:TIGR04283 family arsenosugar biosynthesis glycosyltransferase [bacterium]
MRISAIVPVLNEESVIDSFLQWHMNLNEIDEWIVVDGGSNDRTLERVDAFQKQCAKIKLISGEQLRGRAKQMNAGALSANGEVLLFLHVDCKLDRLAPAVLKNAMGHEHLIGGGFYKKYENETVLLKIYRSIMNVLRTQWLRNLVGTNGIFVRKNIFEKIGGYPDTPILEDMLLCDRMKSAGKLAMIKPYIIVSSRRYFKDGVLRRIVMALKILFLFRIMKISPDQLKSYYLKTVKE